MNPSPEELLSKIKEGDKNSFKLLFDLYYTDLCRFALAYLKDPDNAEDVVQNFFISFWEKRESLTINTSIKSYLFSSVRNRSLNYIRDNSKFADIDDEFLSNQPSGSIEADSMIDTDNLEEKIRGAIEKLPVKCKEIFLLSREQNLSYKQIAERLQISVKTVENQISIALKKLHLELKPYYNALILLFLFFYESGI